MESEFQYYSRRAAEEREAAARAQSQEAERSHRMLADRYAQIAAQCAENAAEPARAV
jgi:hypothetical protein